MLGNISLMQNTMELTQEDIPQNTKGRNGAVDTSL